MKLLLFLTAGSLVLAASAEDLSQTYAGSGELILAPFVSAPFPHPQRAEGHQYKDQFYSASEHYADNTVALFIPKGFNETGVIDLVVHFHGWRNNVAGVLKHYQLIEQLTASGRNAVLVVPQGPKDAADSFGGKLEDPDGFKRFMAEVAATLRQKSGLQRKDLTLGKIVLSGHSGGYQVIASILHHGGLTEQVQEVWLFDALYAQTDKFLAWTERRQGRLIDIYTEHGGTREETDRLMAILKQRGTQFLAVRESEINMGDLPSKGAIFLYSELPHDDVIDKHQTFRDFLKTSFLGERR